MTRAMAGIMLALLVGGCGQTTMRVQLAPGPDDCQVTEVRPTPLSTMTLAVCWGPDGRPLGMASATGKPAINVPLELLGAASPVVGAALLGGALRTLGHIDADVGDVPVRVPEITVPELKIAIPDLRLAPAALRLPTP